MRLKIVGHAVILVVTCSPSLGQQTMAQQKPALKEIHTRADVGQAVDDIQSGLTSLNQHHESYRQAAEKLGELYANLNKKLDGLIKVATAVNSSPASANTASQLMAATKQMQEAQMSFNLQYLQLQTQMQNETQQYTAVSNIMKTKQDTVKNSINNIR